MRVPLSCSLPVPLSSSTQCGGGIYDLSALAASDITYATGNTTYFIRLCGQVSGTQRCAQNASAQAQVCQVDNTGSGTGYPLSLYQPYAYPTVYQYNGNGLSQLVQDGSRCGGAEEERMTNITLVCSQSATTPVVQYVNEAPTCQLYQPLHYTHPSYTACIQEQCNSCRNATSVCIFFFHL